MSKIRKVLVCTTAAAILAGATTGITASAAIRGDVNCDGIVTVADEVLLQRIVNSRNGLILLRLFPRDTNLKDVIRACDVNRDGSVNQADVTALDEILKSRMRTIVGDANGDGYVSYDDVTALKDHLIDSNVFISGYGSDVNRDGSVSVADIVALNRFNLFVKDEDKEFFAGGEFINNNTYRGVLQGDGNVVVYKGGTAVFSTGTNYGDYFRDYRLVFRRNGNIVLYATPDYQGAAEREIWSSGTDKGSRYPEYRLTFDNNGQLEWWSKSKLIWKSTEKGTAKPLTDAEHRKIAYERMYDDNYLYSDYETAAIDFVYYFNPISVSDRCEYSAVINKVYDSDGKLKYKPDMYPYPDEEDTLYGLRGKQRGLNQFDGIGHALNLEKDPVAYVHTHGHEACPENNFFSIGTNAEADMTDFEGVDTYDTTIAYKFKIVGYVGTPNGTLRKFEPGVDTIPDYIVGNSYSRFMAQQNTGRVIRNNIPTTLD